MLTENAGKRPVCPRFSMHPAATAQAVGSAIKSTVVAAAHGDARSIGQIVGTSLSIAAGAGAARGVSAGVQAIRAAGWLGEGFSVSTTEAYAMRGLSRYGGMFSSETNAAGGTIYTSAGGISQGEVGTIVNSAGYSGGEINILSGAHGLPDGSIIPEPAFYQADQAAFGNIPGVTVHDISNMSTTAITDVVNGPGTTIGAFCNSGACLAPYIK